MNICSIVKKTKKKLNEKKRYVCNIYSYTKEKIND